MKKPLIALLFFILISYFIFPISLIHAATSTDSADIDPDTIKENIKKRIEQVVKSQADTNKKRVAYLGALNSVTTNSFSILTGEGGTKQASTSASTVVIELDKNKEMKLDDVSIGDYVAALGYLSENSAVLDTRRVIVLKDKPQPSTKKSIVGMIQNIDLKKNILTINSIASNKRMDFKINAKSSILLTDSSLNKTKIAFKEIPAQTTCLIIYVSSEKDSEIPLATSILIKSQEDLPSPTPSPSASASATPKSKTIYPSASPKS